ncbi:MAG: PspA/IM30 family protein [bacterium]|jgi:phage shock protein A
MSIFSRLFKIGEAKTNQILTSMEDPEIMLDQAIRDKEKEIREAKQSISSCIATERQTKSMMERERQQQRDWEAKAEAALKQGREDLAVKALNRASEHENKAKALEANWQQQNASVESLKQEIRNMEDQLGEYRRNKDYIIAQHKMADVKKKIYDAKSRMSRKSGADDLMARLKDRADRATFEADASQELAESLSGDSLEKEFEQLGATPSTSDVQDKLAALKAKMGQAQS